MGFDYIYCAMIRNGKPIVETRAGVVAVLHVLMIIEVVLAYAVVTIPGVVVLELAVIFG